MLSAIEDGNMVLSFIQKGVRDYVIKDENVPQSLVAVLEGKDDDYLFNRAKTSFTLASPLHCI